MDYLTGTVGCVLCTACSAAPIVLTVYMGIYAFNNPDNPAWLGTSPELENKLYADEAAGLADNAQSMVDIHNRFVNWFMWGFITMIAPIGSALLYAMLIFISPALAQFCGGTLSCAIGCSSIAWWIVGIVWRFRSDGAYAAGDIVPENTEIDAWNLELAKDDSLFQSSSGHFIAIFYIISWSFCACSCLVSMVGACVASMQSKDD